jgi:2-phospho-L-lactate transferase/gluconeogenesis factor (CofD/UPF0052 family)
VDVVNNEAVGTVTAPPQAERKAEMRTRINVVLFSGGSGTKSITEAVIHHPQIALKILINAYDDGHSTGRLRRFIPGMLGPSDVRKNINRLMPLEERSQRALRAISDYRLPVGIPRADALATVERVVAGDAGGLGPVSEQYDRLTVGQVRQMGRFLSTFVAYLRAQEAADSTFDFTDCAIGNLLFAGCYLEEGRDFNRTVEAFSRFFEVSPDILLNIAEGENLFIVAEKDNGAVLLSEAEIVATQDAAKISELFLLDEATYRGQVETATEPPPGGWGPIFRERHCTPRINPRAREVLAAADVIVYGPGTQHSSLLPSYLTEGVAEAIAANRKADKVFIGNIQRDFDIQADDANDLASKLVYACTRKGQVAVNWTDLVSHFFIHRSDGSTPGEAKYIPFDEKRFSFPLETVNARDWETEEGGHSSGYVLDELHRLVQARIDVELQRVHHMVSIIVPVLNEEATIEQVVKALTALDFQPFGMTKEIIVADGGSTDRTVEIARSIPSARFCRLEGGFGRGATMRLGLERARGNVVVFFPGDSEYRPDDLYGVLRPMVESRFRAVFGTRAVKCTNLSERLRAIYGNNWWLYVTSKYGGILLSVLTLILYNRYVTDLLSSVKAYDTHLLRSLGLRSDGIDLESEIVAKLSRKREYMLEVPVDYKPRTRRAGKKIRPFDGLKAIFALVRYRYARLSS